MRYRWLSLQGAAPEQREPPQGHVEMKALISLVFGWSLLTLVGDKVHGPQQVLN